MLELVACCHVRIFGCFAFKPTAILETTAWTLTSTVLPRLCADNCLRKWLLHALLEPSHVSYLTVSTVAGTLVHKDTC